MAERDRFRTAKTAALHARLLARMAAVTPAGATAWDPEVEESRLRRAEPQG